MDTGICWGQSPEAVSCQLLLRHEGDHVWSGIQAQETTSKAAEPREAEAAQTLFGLWRPEGWGEKGKRWCAQQRRIVAVVCSPRRVYFSRMQISEPHFEPWVRGGLGAEFPSRLREDCSGLRPEGIVRPTPALPRRKHIWSEFQARENTSKAAGPREPEAAQTLFGLWRPEG